MDAVFKFKIKIIKSFFQFILVGIVDYEKTKNAISSNNSINAVSYYGAEGLKYPGTIKEGVGFGEGDSVIVEVDLSNRKVKWYVN